MRNYHIVAKSRRSYTYLDLFYPSIKKAKEQNPMLYDFRVVGSLMH